jgi:hypothetical protein
MQPPSNLRLPAIRPALDWDDAETRLFESRARLTLRCSGGPLNGQVLGSDGEAITIGRREGCAVRLLVPECSRVHARIRFYSGQFWVEDLGTLNGTVVNGRPIQGPHALRDGDCIEIGDQVLHVSSGAPAGREVVQDRGLDDSAPSRVSRPLPVRRRRPRRRWLFPLALVGLVVAGVVLVVRRQEALRVPVAVAVSPAPARAPGVVPASPTVTTLPPPEATIELDTPVTLTATADGTVRHTLVRGELVETGARVVEVRESTEAAQRRLDELNAQIEEDEDNAELVEQAREAALQVMSPSTVALRSPLHGIVVGEPPPSGTKVRAGQELVRLAGAVKLRVPAGAITGQGTHCTVKFVNQGDLAVEAEPLGDPGQPVRRFTLTTLPPALLLTSPARVRIACDQARRDTSPKPQL